ncbi:amidase [Dactylosporangium sp. NPDC050688]|uniref:amidase n=1 Tax=Dactylosporangium sp. NPDC050688 TaxID=3157217 RepID=UPI003408263D
MPEPQSIAALARQLRRGETTARDLVAQAIRRADRLDPVLGLFRARFDDAAASAAIEADAALAAGRDRGALHGIPIGLKDIIQTREGPTTAQSVVDLGRWARAADAEVVTRLRRAGAVIVGKLSLAEFAMGVPDQAKPFPLPRNPWDLSRWAGGSSSGTAGAVAAGVLPGALGTDTGGSIRLPAAMCGVTGLRPTHGRAPLAGCLPMAPSLDTIGPVATTAVDCAILFDALVGARPRVPPVREPAGIRVAVADLWAQSDTVHPDQPALFTAAVEVWRRGGAQVRPVQLPHYRDAVAAAQVIQQVEALAVHRELFGGPLPGYAEASRRYLAAAAGYRPADLRAAHRVRRATARAVRRLLADHDVVLTPTTTMPAPAFDDLAPDRTPGGFHTRYWSLLGLPALSVPIGFTSAGLPIGLQLSAAAGADRLVLAAGAWFQRRTGWHRCQPPWGAAGAGAAGG